LVSESWRHRLIAVAADGSQRAVLDNLPVYPSRLSPAASGGFWLTAFAARTQLVEFVLRENAYRRRMITEIDPEYWIAPKLKSGQSFPRTDAGRPYQTMGVVKPGRRRGPTALSIRLDARGAASTPCIAGLRRHHWRGGGRRKSMDRCSRSPRGRAGCCACR